MVLAQLLREGIREQLVEALGVLVGLELGVDVALAQDEELLVEGEGDEILRELGQPRGDLRVAALQHHLEPHAEAPGVEALVFSRRFAVPQIGVEDAGELLRRREGDELACVLQPDALHERPQHGGGQCLDLGRQLGRLQHARHELARGGPPPGTLLRQRPQRSSSTRGVAGFRRARISSMRTRSAS